MIGIAASTNSESRGLLTTIIVEAPKNSTKLRNAMEIEVPAAALICVVSAVSRERTSPVLASSKNALDSVFVSWALRNKPLGAVGYSTGIAAGVRAVEHLMDVAIEMEMVPLRDTVLIAKVESAFDSQGVPVDPMTDIAMTVMLDDLEWWGTLLAKGRADGELVPGSLRIRAAMAQLEKVS